jgi:hypothetical protein
LESAAKADSSRLGWRFGLARRTFVSTVVAAMMNAALAHDVAMMPAMLAAQGVGGFPRRRFLSGRGRREGGPARLGD